MTQMNDPSQKPYQPPSQAPPPAGPPPAEGPDKDARTWGMLCHLAGLAGFLIPFGHIIGPLVIWLIKKDTMPFVNSQGKESLNFQITLTIAYLVGAITTFICVGFIILAAAGILSIVFIIIASMKANQGIEYRYPWALRLVK